MALEEKVKQSAEELSAAQQSTVDLQQRLHEATKAIER